MTTGTIYTKSFEFALTIIELYRALVEQYEYVISKQLLRSGTGIGANVEEASAAQSRKDFLSNDMRSPNSKLKTQNSKLNL